ncbi:MAG TPA: alkaline phosphatase D family protein [Nitrososphaeraceae archaeon]
MGQGNETNFSSKTGFEIELQQLLKFLDDNDIKNIVFVTTDVHFPANILYEVDANNDGDKLIFYDLISGPLSAFRLGMPDGVPIPKLDTTLTLKYYMRKEISSTLVMCKFKRNQKIT